MFTLTLIHLSFQMNPRKFYHMESRVRTADFAKRVLHYLGDKDPLLETECHKPSCEVCREEHTDWVRRVNDLAEAIRKGLDENICI